MPRMPGGWVEKHETHMRHLTSQVSKINANKARSRRQQGALAEPGHFWVMALVPQEADAFPTMNTGNLWVADAWLWVNTNGAILG